MKDKIMKAIETKITFLLAALLLGAVADSASAAVPIARYAVTTLDNPQNADTALVASFDDTAGS